MGFPTANLEAETGLTSGVYMGSVVLEGKSHPAAVFIPKGKKIVEAHILDFSRDIYGEKIEIVIGKKMREIQKFENDEELKGQIKIDLAKIRNHN